jgi:hypothetical protein
MQAARPAGYTALIDRYGLEVIPNWHESFVAASGIHHVESTGDVVREVYLPAYWPGDSWSDHLEFALKYDGTNLGILANLFRTIAPGEVAAYVKSKPTGKYARRIWHWCEILGGTRLPLEDVTRGNYVDLLDSSEYYTSATIRQVRRHRVNDNLLGDSRFCPTVRRTEVLRRFEDADLHARCLQVLSSYPPELVKRASSYLYTKETKSTFELERATPTSTRMERFVALLRSAHRQDFCDKASLIDLQSRIVDPRFRDVDYRTVQNYVGETVAWDREKVHFPAPKPEDLPSLMAGLIASHERMTEGNVHPVVHAAATAFAFVFLHPFQDGNGRIHRLLIHNILARRGFTPEGIIFPVSAAMLNDPAAYDASLEAFSRSLLPLVEYSLDGEGRMTVHNDTASWYRYMDLTAQAEALFGFIEKTANTELVKELAFLEKYDQVKSALQEIVDMPDRSIDLFIRFCLHNRGRLSARKRDSHFAFLTDEEATRMEGAVRAAYGEGSDAEAPTE